MSKVVTQDLVKFGLIPELVGRIPVITSLKDLDVDALVSIITEPKNALAKQYKTLLGMDNVELTFDDDAVVAIAEMALKRKTGARGLRSIMESIMMKIMYRIPSDLSIRKVIITPECVQGAEPRILRDAVHPREGLGGNR